MAFSIPYDDILESKFIGWGQLEIKVAGRSRPIDIILLQDAGLLGGYLGEMLAVRKYGQNLPPGPTSLGQNVYKGYPEFARALDAYKAYICGEPSEDAAPAADYASGAIVEVRRGGGGIIALVAFAVIAAIVIGGGFLYVTSVSEDNRARYGGSTPCRTLALMYRSETPSGINKFMERIDADPSRSLNRFVASQIVGSFLQEVYPETGFDSAESYQCILMMMAQNFDSDMISDDIANEIESEVQNLLGGGG